MIFRPLVIIFSKYDNDKNYISIAVQTSFREPINKEEKKYIYIYQISTNIFGDEDLGIHQ